MIEMKTFRNGNKKLIISVDEDAESPREWDNLGTMICFHRRYDLGDKHDLKRDNFNSLEELEEYLVKERKAVIIFQLNLYDHSGISISISNSYPYNDRWDSSRIGFIYTTKEDIMKWFDTKRVSKEMLKKAEEILKNEVKTYDQYLNGEVYSFVVYQLVKCDSCNHIEENVIDSCGGYFGYDIDAMKNDIEDFENYREE
jgi:hypothetical protein